MEQSVLQPKESLAPLLHQRAKLFIGVPKELSFQENRVALTPETVAFLTSRNHRVVVETMAGEKSGFTDQQYGEAGAEIVYDAEQVFKAHIIIKISPLTQEQLEWVQANQIIFSVLHLPAMKAEWLRTLMKKNVTLIAYEYIKDESGRFPIIRALSEIAGSAAILIASEYLSSTRDGQGLLLGGIAGVPPARIVILGAGTVGEYATRAALGLGAEVRVFDNNIYKLMRLQNNVGVRVYTSIINPNLLSTELSKADVVIGAIHSEAGRAPMVVTESMISYMKPGSVIVDVSIDQGGCFETSRVMNHKNPTFVTHGVIHYCVPNIASRFAKTASSALSHVLLPLLLRLGDFGGFEDFLRHSHGSRNGVCLYNGLLTNEHLSKIFGMRYIPLDLILPFPQ